MCSVVNSRQMWLDGDDDVDQVPSKGMRQARMDAGIDACAKVSKNLVAPKIQLLFRQHRRRESTPAVNLQCEMLHQLHLLE